MGLRFVHAADLHLGSQFAGVTELHERLSRRVIDASLSAFSNLVNFCIESDVDFLVLAGDVFETNRPSLRTQKHFVDQLARLNKAEIDVYMVTGNHDAGFLPNFVFSMPENLYLFSTDKVDVIRQVYKSRQVTLSGISYANTHVGDLSQLFPRPDFSSFNIAVLHCDVGSQEFGYAPVALSDLAARGYHYWAIGHVHSAKEWKNNCVIQYPGILQGRHRGESGPKGCYLVDVDRNMEISSEFVPLQDIIWKDIGIDLTLTTPEQLFTTLNQNKDEHRADYPVGTMLNVTLTGASGCYQLLKESDTITDLLSDLREGEPELENFIWVTGIDDQTLPEIDWSNLRQRGDFLAEVIAFIEELEADTETLDDEIAAAAADIARISQIELSTKELLQKAKLLAVQLLTGEN